MAPINSEHTVYGKLWIASLNINGMKNKLTVLLRDFAYMKLDIIGIQETHCPGNNTADFKDYKLFCSGTTSNSWSGIAFLANKKIEKSIIKFVPISERCGLLYLNTKFKPTIIVNIYAPPRRNERLNFIDTVTTLIDSLPLRYNIIIIGDLNLKIGKSTEYINTNTIGNATIQQPNNIDSKKLLDYCKTKNFKIENTFFLHREINTYTFVRANQKSQIDFIISNIHAWFDDVIVSTIIKLSDHRALVAKMTIKNTWGYREEIDPNMTRINFLKPLLNRKQIKVKSQEDIQLFDQILVRKRENFLNITSNGNVDICWNLFKKDITESYNMLPNMNVYLRREWLSNETVGKISQLRGGNNLNRELWKEIQKFLRSDV
ncbi:uncharacterized protein LOC135924024 [Gordionus sp. m RMFG-2023]|uniref:uncharacterized protein LOC135924024 n=1 Tax=Gordionus sp. m RMFG-2023 TaxID=3053472 RepID=UPI0031FCC763